MKVPRDISGSELVAALHRLGYSVVRQKGSHIRVSTEVGGAHHLTVPDHAPLKIGTLSAILHDLGLHHGLSRDQVLERLFG